MAKILFVSDNLFNESLGIMCLSAYLKANGHDVDITLISEYRDVDGLLSYVKDSGSDIVGFSLMTPQLEDLRPIVQIIKKNLNHKIIWGGPHCMFMADDVVKYDYVDFICTGEGEEPLLELMNRLNTGKSYLDVPGLWVRDGEKWIRNNLPRLEENLDKYPPPDRELYYAKYPLLRDFAIKRLMTQRGCPYKCAYCFEPSFAEIYKGKGKLVRRRSVENVIAEIKGILKKYPARVIHFSDDTFNLNKKWVYEFAREYQKQINFPFTCNITVQILDEEMVRRLSEAGCRGVVYGLETGLEKNRFETLNKPIPDETYVKASNLLRKYGIKFQTNIMFALPNETIDDAIKSIAFNKKLNPFNTRAGILKVYKGTTLGESLLKDGMVEAEEEFTYKVRDPDKVHDKLKNMVWAAFILVKFPFAMPLAKTFLNMSHPFVLKYFVLIVNWKEIIFFRIPLWQAWKFFWNSRKEFFGGIGKAQEDVARHGKSGPG